MYSRMRACVRVSTMCLSACLDAYTYVGAVLIMVDLPDGACRAAVGVREPVRDGGGVPERVSPIHRQLPAREPRCGRFSVYHFLLAVDR